MNRWTDKQMDRYIDRQTNIETVNRQADRWTDT